jgi:hypothetical protein
MDVLMNEGKSKLMRMAQMFLIGYEYLSKLFIKFLDFFFKLLLGDVSL